MVAVFCNSRRSVRLTAVTPSLHWINWRGRPGGAQRDALELPAGGVDIQPSRLAHETGQPAADDALEARHPLGEWRGVRDSRPGIEGNQVDFGVEVSQELDHTARVGIAIVDAMEQHVLEGELLAGGRGR